MSSTATVSVFGINGEEVASVPRAAVLSAPIRPDIVSFVHTNIAKNHRQAYAVSRRAGKQAAAESWGPGRAVARIPRVAGSGTSRAGQGAYGNMTRGGHMFNPTRTHRRWHRKVNINLKRYAVASALAASAVSALVTARGHKIGQLAHLPIVIDTPVESITKTKEAVAVLNAVGLKDELQKVVDSKTVRAGLGKMRGRRYKQRKGPLVVYANDEGIAKAVRNIPGVDVANVSRLNLLDLAPGGHMGRLIVWTRPAFEALDSVFGTFTKASEQKLGYTLPSSNMKTTDLLRIVGSESVQAVLRKPKVQSRRTARKVNPLRNRQALLRLNPNAKNTKGMFA